MARPLHGSARSAAQAGPDGLRTHVLEAAARVLERDGLAAVSTRRVAVEAGVAVGTLYAVARDRTDLVAQAVLHQASLATSPMTELTSWAGTATVRENLARFVLLAATVLDRVVPLLSAVVADPPVHAAVRRRLAEAPALGDPVGTIARYLDAEAAVGRVRVDSDRRAAAALLVALCHEDAFVHGLVGEGPRPDRRAELDLLAASLAPAARGAGHPPASVGDRRPVPPIPQV